MWLLWIGAQGLLTASLVPGLAVRHGVVAFLGPAAVTSVVPGPSDLPIRYQMLTSWGRTTGEATLAVAAGGIFSIGVKLALPIIAAIGLLISDAPISGTLRTVVVICLLVGIGVAVLAVVLGSEKPHRAGGPADRADLGPGTADVAQAGAGRSHHTDGRRSCRCGPDIARPVARGQLGDDADRRHQVRAPADDAAVHRRRRRRVAVDAGVRVFALVQGLTVFPITAGDAGVSEIAYIGMLTAAAGEEWVNQITAAILIFRILTWLVIIPVGLGVLGFWRHQLRRNPPDPESGSTDVPTTSPRRARQNSNCTAARSATRPVMWSAMSCWCSGWSR